MNHTKKVIVGMSGGVDSSVAALLLKEQGFVVHGVFMLNWNDVEDPHCSAQQDLTDARTVCDKLNIPLSTVSFAQEYWDHVFQYFLNEYSAGRTPNPDILCNTEIKFKAFLNYALEQSADFIATGHYVRNRKVNDRWQLLKGLDNNKDQSYFLHGLNQQQLSKSLFPIGELEKTTVRKIAKKQGFLTHDKKDSTGICFIGERKFNEFLNEYLLAQPGDIKTVDGDVIGKHQGLMFHTIGQRKGLHIGGLKNSKELPWFVIDKDMKNNVLIVAQGHNHPQLLSQDLTCEDIHWISGKMPDLPLKCKAKTRYRQPEQPCSAMKNHVHFDEPQWAVTPGQSVVVYQDEICLGGAVINKASKTP